MQGRAVNISKLGYSVLEIFIEYYYISDSMFGFENMEILFINNICIFILI